MSEVPLYGGVCWPAARGRGSSLRKRVFVARDERSDRLEQDFVSDSAWRWSNFGDCIGILRNRWIEWIWF